MNVIQAAVHAALTEEPVTAQAIVEKVDGNPSLNMVQYALRDLIAQDKAKRHHSGDGILRYSRMGAPAAPVPAPAPKPTPTPKPVAITTPAPAPKPESGTTTALGATPAVIRDRVLATLSDTPQSARDIAAQTGLPQTSVRTALKRLRALGMAELEGATTSAKWHRATAPRPSTSAPAKPSLTRTALPPPAKKAAVLGERKRDFLAAAEQSQNVLKALEFNRDTARDALQLYVASLVDSAIYEGLNGALNSAQSALDAFVAGGRA